MIILMHKTLILAKFKIQVLLIIVVLKSKENHHNRELLTALNPNSNSMIQVKFLIIHLEKRSKTTVIVQREKIVYLLMKLTTIMITNKSIYKINKSRCPVN